MEDFTVIAGYSGQSGINNEPIAPSSHYNKISENLRRVTPHHISCSMFCGGKRCKYERGTYWASDACAIDGLYSHWITDDIVAMSRPSTSVIEAFDILRQFDTLGIKSVINLEVPGEHANCSLTPLHPSGFAYDPGLLMENGIYFYNYSWKDYGEASLAYLLDMVKVLSFSVAEGKAAVHCHAGLGRTGVLIACYLVYAMRLRANDAIRLVRNKRPGSIQSRLHILCVQQFEQFILPNCIIFCNRELLKDKKLQDFTLSQYLKRQRVILHGKECKTLRHIPKILTVICEKLLTLSGRPNVILLRQDEDDEPQPIPATPDTPTSYTPIPSSSTGDDGSSSTKSVSSNSVTNSVSHSVSNSNHIQHNEHPYKYSDVVRALLSDHINMAEGLTRYVRQYRIELNQKGVGAWHRLTNEKNLYVLTGLLLLWLEHLRNPLLGSEELTTVVLHANNPRGTLKRIPFESATTLDYLLHFIANLNPSEVELEIVLRRIAASVTHRVVQSTKDMTIAQGYHTVNPEKGKPRKLSDGTMNKVLEVLRGIVKEFQEKNKMESENMMS